MTTITTMLNPDTAWNHDPKIAEIRILTIDEISAAMYVNGLSVRKMSQILGVDSSRVHAMFKYKDEFHNRLLRVACTHVLNSLGGWNLQGGAVA